MRLPVLDADKANHAVYGAAICALCALPVMMLPITALAAPLVGVLTAAVVGVWKERRDAHTAGATADRRDIVATVGGALLVAVPLLVSEVMR